MLLCLVTSRHQVGGAARLPAFAAEAARAGVDLIHVRERDLADGELATLVREVVAATAGTATRVLVNERVDVALAAGAAGVHLRADSMAASRLRPLVPTNFMIGRSVHSVTDALEAERDSGCDYLVFGTIFPSASKPEGHKAAGPGGLRRVCEAVRLPVLAIGGISIDNASQVMAAGAAGLAAIGLFARAPQLADAVRELRRFDR